LRIIDLLKRPLRFKKVKRKKKSSYFLGRIKVFTKNMSRILKDRLIRTIWENFAKDNLEKSELSL
jgi:hypothetical protein